MISDESTLEKDLGITGDDMWDILEKMVSEFKVDLDDVDFTYFFYPECAGFIWSVMNKDKVKSIKTYPITVKHLVSVVQKGKWFTPERLN